MEEAAAATPWSELMVALLVVVVGSAVAALWPWLMTRQRRSRFQRLIRRELQETGPFPDEPADDPWWHHLKKRFVHEEIFARKHISENRDFLLSLEPTVTYHVNQLWTSFEKRDLEQWSYHLGELSTNKHVGSTELQRAADEWTKFRDKTTGASDTVFVRAPADTDSSSPPRLLEDRLCAYGALLPLTRVQDGRAACSPEELEDWFFTGGNGLLLSGDAHRAYLEAKKKLNDPVAPIEDVDEAMSTLRTELKIDMDIRHPDERGVELAQTLERRTF